VLGKTTVELSEATGIRRRVLIVDDTKDSADFLALYVGYLGHETALAYEGTSAIALAEEFRPDICFMDVYMPGMDGLMAARTLLARPWSTALKLVAVTALSSAFDCQRIRESGFCRHLIKPIELAGIKGIISELTPARLVQ
jgi:CheY-like chemotaxis protein